MHARCLVKTEYPATLSSPGPTCWMLASAVDFDIVSPPATIRTDKKQSSSDVVRWNESPSPVRIQQVDR